MGESPILRFRDTCAREWSTRSYLSRYLYAYVQQFKFAGAGRLGDGHTARSHNWDDESGLTGNYLVEMYLEVPTYPVACTHTHRSRPWALDATSLVWKFTRK